MNQNRSRKVRQLIDEETNNESNTDNEEDDKEEDNEFQIDMTQTDIHSYNTDF